MTSLDRSDDVFAEIQPFVGQLVAKAGLGAKFHARRVERGRNNRVFHLTCEPADLALKWYYQDKDTDRNRLGAEYSFCDFCWSHGIETVPQPLAIDSGNQLGLYEWVRGSRIQAATPTDEQVDAALRFVGELNRYREDPAAERLAPAAEACFSVASHLDCVERRVARLMQLESINGIQGTAAAFVRGRLLPVWRTVARAVTSQSSNDSDLPLRDRCLSPSDFGFHNALITDDGSVRFLDFEYAGWDDPAKLVCDFFCQVEFPVSLTQWEAFVQSVSAVADDPLRIAQRCNLLLPVYRIKWACIVLNEFLTEHASRRHFSESEPPTDERLQQQLQKAEQIVNSVEPQR